METIEEEKKEKGKRAGGNPIKEIFKVLNSLTTRYFSSDLTSIVMTSLGLMHRRPFQD